MDHIKNVEKFGIVSFKEVGFKTSIEVAKEMKNQISSFFKENPNGFLEFDFGGYARLSKEFAEELFKDETIKKFQGQIRAKGMHIFDITHMNEAFEKV